MLPLELIRRDPDRVRRAAELKREPAPIDEILELDREWRAHLHAGDQLTEVPVPMRAFTEHGQQEELRTGN